MKISQVIALKKSSDYRDFIFFLWKISESDGVNKDQTTPSVKHDID